MGFFLTSPRPAICLGSFFPSGCPRGWGAGGPGQLYLSGLRQHLLLMAGASICPSTAGHASVEEAMNLWGSSPKTKAGLGVCSPPGEGDGTGGHLFARCATDASTYSVLTVRWAFLLPQCCLPKGSQAEDTGRLGQPSAIGTQVSAQHGKEVCDYHSSSAKEWTGRGASPVKQYPRGPCGFSGGRPHWTVNDLHPPILHVPDLVRGHRLRTPSSESQLCP